MAKPTKIIHRSARGTIIDMDTLRNDNGDMQSLGNIKMNARGDILDDDGNVVKRRTQIVQDYYRDNPSGVKKVSLRTQDSESFETPAQALQRLTTNTATAIPDAPSGVIGKKGARRLVNPSKE